MSYELLAVVDRPSSYNTHLRYAVFSLYGHWLTNLTYTREHHTILQQSELKWKPTTAMFLLFFAISTHLSLPFPKLLQRNGNQQDRGHSLMSSLTYRSIQYLLLRFLFFGITEQKRVRYRSLFWTDIRPLGLKSLVNLVVSDVVFGSAPTVNFATDGNRGAEIWVSLLLWSLVLDLNGFL